MRHPGNQHPEIQANKDTAHWQISQSVSQWREKLTVKDKVASGKTGTQGYSNLRKLAIKKAFYENIMQSALYFSPEEVGLCGKWTIPV